MLRRGYTTGNSKAKKICVQKMFGLAIPVLAIAILCTIYILKRSGVISESEFDIGMMITVTSWLPWELFSIVREFKQKSEGSEN